MVSKLRFQMFSFSLMVFAFLFGQSYHVTEGFEQSLKLYFDNTTDGDFLDFETHHPNMDDYSALLPKVKLACTLGWWYFYSAPNYTYQVSLLGSPNSNQPYCKQINGTDKKSLRYLGMSDTFSDGLSLYEKDFYRGTEILVKGAAHAEITTPVESIVATGQSQWKLFEGQHLDGKSVCIQVPSPGRNFYAVHDVQSVLRFTTIGSVFKGCNILEIEGYKRNNNM